MYIVRNKIAPCETTFRKNILKYNSSLFLSVKDTIYFYKH